MFEISYTAALIIISAAWVLVRAAVWLKNRKIDIKREGQLLLFYMCIAVVVRFTFFPFFKVDGAIAPLVFDMGKAFSPRLNFLPLVYLLDYEVKKEIIINVIGNTSMFIPIGIILPSILKRLDNHFKAIAAGIGFSLCIEIAQLPFYDRVSDVDDLILNSLGYVIGYLLLLAVRACVKKIRKR